MAVQKIDKHRAGLKRQQTLEQLALLVIRQRPIRVIALQISIIQQNHRDLMLTFVFIAAGKHSIEPLL